HFDEEIRARQEAAGHYSELINQKIPEIQTPVVMPDRTCVYAQYTVRIPGGLRDQVTTFLKQEGIPFAIHYPAPVHLQPAFKGLGLGPGFFPHAEKAAEEVLSLPMHAFITPDEQEIVIEGLEMAMGVT
ncbi:MAG: DegT/DnrJ/EryC1/StrS family aminotransferase, partial [Deltaproteobacteria bacterium]|nr:DegT/DnrJ/EryC1/StrS family aminotransferase [Deltaproteobacteria bacterium]